MFHNITHVGSVALSGIFFFTLADCSVTLLVYRWPFTALLTVERRSLAPRPPCSALSCPLCHAMPCHAMFWG